jgi:hypothetical protein
MTNAAGALLTERSFDLRDRPAEILVQLLKSLVQRLELAGTGFVISAIRICTIDVELFLRRGSEKGIVNSGQGTLNPFFAVGGITHTPTTRYICRLPTLRVSLLIDCSSLGHSMAKAGRNGAAGRAKMRHARVRSIHGIKACHGGASLSAEPGPLRGAAKPGAEVPYSRTPDDGDIATGALLSPESCGAPAHRVVELVQQVEPGIKQGVAPLMPSHR